MRYGVKPDRLAAKAGRSKWWWLAGCQQSRQASLIRRGRRSRARAPTLAVTAKASTAFNAGIASGKLSAEATAKATYNYKTNQSSYNSNYASRTLTETESTDNDDFISGRAQVFNIWRYRVLGVTDQNGLNSYYDAVLPGPVVNFKASGLDLDWYQP